MRERLDRGNWSEEELTATISNDDSDDGRESDDDADDETDAPGSSKESHGNDRKIILTEVRSHFFKQNPLNSVTCCRASLFSQGVSSVNLSFSAVK